MQAITELALLHGERGIFTREEAALWADNHGARLDGLLKRAVQGGEVWRIVRGLYVLSDRFRKNKLNSFELAQRISGPSYVSLESALSYHGWIPEAVHAVTSVGMRRSFAVDSPLGRFTFTRVPQRLLFAGVRRVVVSGEGAFFLATPLKALADLVYAQNHTWDSVAPLIESLRVDEASLAEVPNETFDEVLEAYKPGRVQRFLAGIRKELNK